MIEHFKNDFVLVPNRTALSKILPKDLVTFFWLCARVDENGRCSSKALVSVMEDTLLEEKDFSRSLDALERAELIVRDDGVEILLN